MKLPSPFDHASYVKTNPDGSINLIDVRGKALARVPMTTAFELSPEIKGHGHGDHGFDSGSGYGHGSGDGYGDGDGFGDGYGDDIGDGYGSGKSE